jgi:hypothetical protein
VLRGQYTYTATSRAGVWDQGAGWKVQSVATVPGQAPVPEGVVRSAVRHIGGFVPPALPELASQADVDALPRCLRLDELDQGLACLSHVVAAGPDYSGRPNFYAHGLLLDPAEEEVDEQGFLRPADLWDAELWLRPLGTQAVEVSEPDARLRHLERGPLDADALETFTRRHPNQRDLVFAAFERHIQLGPPLVVVGDQAESVAQWVRLLGLLLLPATAWRLRFSTYERLRDATTAAGWPFAVVGVPTADAGIADRLPGAQFTVLHDDRPPGQAGLHRWALGDGTALTAGRWAQLAETVVAAGLLPEVVQQIDALAIECGDSTAAQPLWALAAAVLLLDDLPAELIRDAAELALEHWPTDAALGRSTTEVLLARLSAWISPPSRVAEVLLARSSPTNTMATQLAVLGPVREALADPGAYEKLGSTLITSVPPLDPAARHDLDDVLADALAWVPLAGASAPRALLAIAALVDRERSEPGLRTRAADLARTWLAPAMLAEGADPLASAWPPVPGWLWIELRSALSEALELGRHEPGLGLPAAVHRWLGGLSLPRGPLSAPALAATGPVEWERAANSVFRARPRPAAPSPLELAAYFLAAVHSSPITEGLPEDRWASTAVEAVYTRAYPLDLPTALVLMRCLPAHIPFWPVLVTVLDQTIPSAVTAEAVAQLRERETVPDSAEVFLERHENATGSGDLISSTDQVFELTTQALLVSRGRGWVPEAWVPVAEALLRVDICAMPLKGLPTQLDDPEMPWEAGWELLEAQHTDPAIRILLAAHLLCRTARVQRYPNEDQALKWITAPSDRAACRGEAAAATLVAGHEAPGQLVELVEQLVQEAPRKPGAPRGPDHPDVQWREVALATAQRVVKQSGGSPVSRARGPLRRNRA